MTIISLDTETYEYNQQDGYYYPTLNTNKFVLGCIKENKKKNVLFYDKEAMINYIDKLVEKNAKWKKNVHIYGNNIEYDVYTIYGDKILSKDFRIISFRPFLLEYKKNCLFIDLMNITRMSVENLGDLLKFNKLKMPDKIRNPNELENYIIRDTDIVYEVVIKIKEMLKQKNVKPKKLLTIASLSKTYFYNVIKKEKLLFAFNFYNKETKRINIYKTKQETFIRNGYKGAINYAFRKGYFENVAHLDVKGMYGYIMKNMHFPDLKNECAISNDNIELEHFLTILYNFQGLAEITISIPKLKKSPVFVRYDNKLINVKNAIVKGIFSFSEIDLFIKKKIKIIKIHKIVYYPILKTNPFEVFINEVYNNEKNAKNDFEKTFYKMIRNNLYGKFAQKSKKTEYLIIKRNEIDNYLNQEYTIINEIYDNYVLKKEYEQENKTFVNPVLSCLISAEARSFMIRNFDKIDNDDLLYTDTDSLIITNFEKYKNVLNVGEDLGQFSIKGYGNVEIFGEKKYKFNEKYTISGVKKKSIQLSDNEFLVKRMVKLKSALSKEGIKMLGRFKENIITINDSSKSDVIYPSYIEEQKLY